MRHLFLTSLLFLALQTHSSQAWACESVFAFRAHQENLVQSFEKGDFEVQSFEVLPHSKRSFYVHVPEGKVVLRLESHTNDLQFEVFASDTFEGLGLLTAKVSIAYMPKSLVSELKLHIQQNPDEELAFLMRENTDFLMSVASFFDEPFELGIDHLLRVPEYKAAIEARQSQNEDNRDQMWRYLDPSIQTKIADTWAGYVVLGIPDMHPHNWMIGPDGQVAGIDLAIRSGIFEKGIASLPWMMLMSPLGPADIGKEHLHELLSSLSPRMRQVLASLSRDDILAIAAKSQFQISDVQVNGMLARAKKLADPSF